MDLRPAYDADAELAVLAAAFLDADARRAVAVLVTPDDFYLERHRRVYRAVLAVHESGADVDPVTVAAQLEAAGDLDMAGGRAFLGELLDAIPTTTGAAHHAKIVHECAVRRSVARAMLEAAQGAADRTVPLRALVTGALDALLPVATDAHGPGYQHVRELIYPALNEVEARTNGKRGLLTGYDAIDRVTYGFRPGELVILGGAEKSGKSVASLNVALRIARRRDVGVAYVSAEMQSGSLVERALASLSGVPVNALASGKLSGDEWPRVSQAAGDLSQMPFYVDDEAEPRLGDVVARAAHLKALHPEVELIIVDFLQLVHHRIADRSEATELKSIAYALKGMAKRLNVVVLAPCQVNSKEIEVGKDPRPALKDLQGSGGMRQAADFVALIFRPGLYQPSAPDADAFELNFAACRRTERFVARLRWEGAVMRIH